jgi:hypothetical protein
MSTHSIEQFDFKKLRDHFNNKGADEFKKYILAIDTFRGRLEYEDGEWMWNNESHRAVTDELYFPIFKAFYMISRNYSGNEFQKRVKTKDLKPECTSIKSRILFQAHKDYETWRKA